RGFDEAKDLARPLVYPVALVVDTVLRLLLKIFHVRLRSVARGNASRDVVDVHVEGHDEPPVDAGSAILRRPRSLVVNDSVFRQSFRQTLSLGGCALSAPRKSAASPPPSSRGRAEDATRETLPRHRKEAS